MEKSIETQIITIINDQGPLLGKEIMAHFNKDDYIQVWKTCFESNIFHISHFARYYLRYDIAREDQIRLSPSVLRDFLSFTLISLPHQRSQVIDRQIMLSNHHREISMRKLKLAYSTILDLDPAIAKELNEKSCYFISGDIAYFLAHEEPREAHDLGELVKGSDIDIINIYDDDLDPEIIKKAEETMLAKKHMLLKQPSVREELDFIFKPYSRMETQFSYKDIREKIACKILYESLFVAGSLEVYSRLKDDMRKAGVDKKIEADFEQAMEERKSAIKKIMSGAHDPHDANTQSLFFFSQERLEFI